MFNIAWANNIDSVSATGFDEAKGHKPENMIDGNIKTRWAVNGKMHSALFKLKDETLIDNVVLIPFKPLERQLKFDLLISKDNHHWVPIANNIQTSNKYDNGEKFILKKTITAQYLKINVYGTNVNKWSSLIQVEVNSSNTYPETTLP
ncbi:MAG: discoidin domain-containing protein [Providencia sp.]|jgi:hypothetical protein|nr:discoidin domain-containing protein [Providencia sp.]